MSSEHKYAREQRVVVDAPENIHHGLEVEIVALLPDRCHAHNALAYGCVHNGDHLSICELWLKPLDTKRKRKMN